MSRIIRRNAVDLVKPTRRGLLKGAGALSLGAGLAALPLKPVQAGTITHGLSVFGELKYPKDFTRFDYVNPEAPKGGRFIFLAPFWYFNQDPQTFDTLNGFVTKGSAPPRVELCFDSLMVRALDEPDAVYGLLAETVEVSADGNVLTFTIRSDATFADGSPLTAEDVAFSYNLLKDKGHPTLSEGLRELVGCEAIDATVVEMTFSGRQSASAALEATGYPIFAKTWWDSRDFEASTLEPILGSGAYRVGAFEQGRFIEYVRRDDYWAAGHPTNVGQNNFDVLRIEFYRERTAEFEAFKKGEILYREEFTSKTWATEYTFPAIVDGRVKKAEFPVEARPSVQALFLNLRRPAFADPRVRRALAEAFDFEWANKNLFYGIYARQDSFFQKSDFRAEGEPSAEERALLEPFRAELPPEVFGPAVMPPVSDGSGRDRMRLRAAADLLAEAGWTRDGGALRNAAGETLRLELLIDAAIFERVFSSWIEALKAIGVDASIRLVDAAQYQSRTTTFDFDVVMRAFSMGATPVESLDAFFASRLADVEGSYNLGGIRHPVVDRLVEIGGRAKSRAELVTACRALDRVLRALHVWIPCWYSSSHRVAHWDVFDHPETKPAYGFPVESTWWIDAEKAAALGKGLTPAAPGGG